MIKNNIKNFIIKELKRDYTKADNFRKLYIIYLENLGYELTPEVYINPPAKSDATINKALEEVLNDLKEKWHEYGFARYQAEYFDRCRKRGKKQAERCRQEAIGIPKAQLAGVFVAEAETKKSWEDLKQQIIRQKQLSFLNNK
jgi:hypothetical protein